MKASSKLLIVIATAMVVVAIAQALLVRAEFSKISGQQQPLETFSMDTITQIEVVGTAPKGNHIQVSLRRGDEIGVEYTPASFIRMENDGTKLKIYIDHFGTYANQIKRQPTIAITCPHLESFSMVGTPLDSLDLPDDAHVMTRHYYSKSTVNIDGYTMDKLTLYAANGAEVKLRNAKIDSLDGEAHATGTLDIRDNILGDAFLKVSKLGRIEVSNPRIGTLRTHVDPEGELLLKGMDLVIEKNGKHH